MQEIQAQSLGQEDPLEEEMITHSSILAWKILRTEESGGPCITLVFKCCLNAYLFIKVDIKENCLVEQSRIQIYNG